MAQATTRLKNALPELKYPGGDLNSDDVKTLARIEEGILSGGEGFLVANVSSAAAAYLMGYYHGANRPLNTKHLHWHAPGRDRRPEVV